MYDTKAVQRILKYGEYSIKKDQAEKQLTGKLEKTWHWKGKNDSLLVQKDLPGNRLILCTGGAVFTNEMKARAEMNEEC